MQAGLNKIIVRTKKLSNDTISSNILDVNGEAQELYLDTSYSPLHHAKIDVEVVSVGMMKGGEIHNKYIGFPTYAAPYKQFARKGHESEYIQKSKAASFREFLGYENFNWDIQAGDTVYMHYIDLSEGNELFVLDGYHYFNITPSNIFCVVRDGKIIPQLGWILVSPFYGKEVTDIVYYVDDKKVEIKGVVDEKTGLVIETGNKPKYLTGVVEHSGKSEGFHKEEIASGSVILFQNKSEFDNEIEGETYYTMRSWDVVAVLDTEDNTFNAVRDYVEVVPDESETETESGFTIVNPEHKNTGVVMSVGKAVKELKPGDRICFEKGSGRLIRPHGIESIFLAEEDVYYKAIEII